MFNASSPEYTGNTNINNQNTVHTGLVGYNINTIDNSETNRICPGMHVWTGDEWQPLVPYPTFPLLHEILQAKYPPKQITDVRGTDTQKYWTAWFGTSSGTENRVSGANSYPAQRSFGLGEGYNDNELVQWNDFKATLLSARCIED